MWFDSISEWVEDRKQKALCETEMCELELIEKYEGKEGCKVFVCEVLQCPHCKRQDKQYYMTLNLDKMDCVYGPGAKVKAKRTRKKPVRKVAKEVEAK